jgi:hypothetical protein
MSCASPGNCTAGGYLISGGGQQAMVVSETGGTWGNAEIVPGSAALNTGGEAEIDSVSCASPGNCTAAGGYATPAARSEPAHAFLVSETNGTWGTARKVPGLAALGTGQSLPGSVSCASAGNCTAGGFVTSKSREHAFVVSQVNGMWGDAQKVPGLAASNTISGVNSVSCAAPGNCTAGGFYVRPPGTGVKAFAVIQRKGTWGTARPIPGMGEIDVLSCATTRNCTAGGGSIAVTKTNGTWGKAAAIPGLAILSGGGHAFIRSLSCASPGTCAAGGYTAGSNGDHAFLASQAGGTWATAQTVPGLPATTSSFVNSVSCGAAGNCAAVGFNDTPAHRTPGFVISETNGTWGTAKEPSGLAALNKRGFAPVNAVSCATAGNCAAGGSYAAPTSSLAFTVSQTTAP